MVCLAPWTGGVSVKKPAPIDDMLERQRRLRRKNIAVMLVLVSLVILFFAITILRMGGS